MEAYTTYRLFQIMQEIFGPGCCICQKRNVKNGFFGRMNTVVWMHHMDTDLAYGKKAWEQSHKNAANCIEYFQEEAFHKTPAPRTPFNDHKN